jgi:hypothetical protein
MPTSEEVQKTEKKALTREEILEIVLECKRKCSSSRDSSDFDSKPIDTLYKKWVNFSGQLFDKSKTLEEYRQTYEQSPPGSKPNKDALYQWNKLWNKRTLKLAETAKTPLQAREVQYNSLPDSQARRIALIRRKKLCLTSAQAWKEYLNSPLGSEERDDFLFLYIELCNTVEELEVVLGGQSRGSVGRLAALKKLKELQARDEKEKGGEIGYLE